MDKNTTPQAYQKLLNLYEIAINRKDSSAEQVGIVCCANLPEIKEWVEEMMRERLDFLMLKTKMITLFGSELGRQDDVEHLMAMANLCLKGWIEENKKLREENKFMKDFIYRIDKKLDSVKI